MKNHLRIDFTSMSKPQWSLLILFCVVLSFILINALIGVRYNCFNNYDLGIPQQAMVELTSSGNLNPYYSLRGTHVFNDHFDPIQFLPGLIIKIFNYSVEATLVWEWFTCLLFVLLLWVIRKEAQWSERLFIAFVTYFSKGIIIPLTYPAHPSFWATPVFLGMTYGLLKRNHPLILLMGFVLCLFKENYPFALLTLGFYFILFKEHRKTGISIFLIGGAFTAFSLWIRPLLVGPITGFGMSMARDFFSSPISTVLKTFFNFNCISFFKIFMPLIALAVLPFLTHSKEILKSIKEWRYHPWIAITAFLFPIFLIQFLANNFYFQYSFPFFACWLALFYLEGDIANILDKKFIGAIILALFFVSSASSYTKIAKRVLLHESDKCVISEEKNTSTQVVKKIIANIPLDRKIISTGGIIPQIIRPGIQLFHLMADPKNIPSFDYLLIEKNNTGDTYPVGYERLVQVIEKCTPYFETVLHEDYFYLLAQGEIPNSCIY